MTTYHAIFAVQHHRPGAPTYFTWHGTYDPPAGATRQRAFEEIRAHVLAEAGFAQSSISVLYFSMEPNELA